MSEAQSILDEILEPETIPDPAPPPPPAETEPDETSQPRQAESEQDQDAPTGDAPVKLADLARKLDMEPNAFFAAVNSDGLSAADAFKAAKGVGSLDADRVTFEAERNDLRLEKAQALQTIRDYVSLLPQGAIDQRLLTQLGDATTASNERENGLKLAAIPEWKVPEQRATEQSAMTGFARKFGIAPSEVEALDHRWSLLLRSVSLEREALNRLLKENRPKPKGVKRGPGRPDKATPAGDSVDIDALIRSANQ